MAHSEEVNLELEQAATTMLYSRPMQGFWIDIDFPLSSPVSESSQFP